LPSRVRSPTPQKTETPPCCSATLWMSSWIRIVLPTPAPPDFAAADVRGDEVDDFQAGLEDLDRRREIAERRRVAVDGPAVALCFLLAVDRVADHIPDAAERHVADRHRDRLLRVDDLDSPREPVGRVHRDSTDAVVAEVLLHLRDQLSRPALLGDVDAERVVDLGELVREDRVEHDALDLDDLPRVLAVALVGHWISPR